LSAKLGASTLQGISACLLGVACRYDGRSLPSTDWYPIPEGSRLMPICPEQLGGLSTPRACAQIAHGSGADVLEGCARVTDATGADVTEAFVRGARETLRLCRSLGIGRMILKTHSPSCGAGTIRRGIERVAGDGVTAALLRREGIEVVGHPQ
jgi:uncharacterized protein YbbK (DUF523 family)